MKKLFYSLTISSILLVLVVMLQSCKQDLAVQPTQAVENAPVIASSTLKLENVEVIDGRLVFKSQDELKAAHEKMSKNQKDLGNFEAQFKGFTSQRQAFENFSSADLDRTKGDLTPFQDYVTKNVTDGEVSYDEVVMPKIYSHLISAEGLIQVGDKVYKFAPSFIYEFSVNDMASYRANKNNLSLITNVQKMDLKVRRQSIKATSRFASSQKTDTYESNTRRTIAYLSTSEPCCFFAWTADVILKHQINGFWGWTGERTELQFNGSVSYGAINYEGIEVRDPTSPRSVFSFEPNNSKASIELARNSAGFQYVYFAPTSVNYTAIKQTRPVSRANLSTLNISF